MKRVLSIFFSLILIMQMFSEAFAYENIIVTASEGGTVTTAEEETRVFVTATPAEGYEFYKWSYTIQGGVPAEIIIISEKPVTEEFTRYENETRRVTAIFKEKSAPIEKYTISASVDPAGSGTVNGNSSVSIEHAYTTDDPVVSLTALPAAGYIFDGWYEGGNKISSSASEVFDANRSRSLVARFTVSNPNPEPVNPDPVNPDPLNPPSPLTKYTITYMPGKYSSGSTYSTEWYAGQVNLLGQTYARTGYTQTGWSADEVGKSFSLNAVINLDRNLTLYPYWEKVSVPLYLTLDIGQGGVVQLNGGNVPNGWTGKLEPNQSYTFYFYPAPNWYVYRLGLAGWHYPVQRGNAFTVTYEMMVGKNQTLQIRFADARSHPPTGDDSNIALWCILGVLSAAAAGTIIVKKRKADKG